VLTKSKRGNVLDFFVFDPKDITHSVIVEVADLQICIQ
jgi:hypothetical protein